MTWRDKEIQRQIVKLKTNNIYIFVKHLNFARFQCQLYIACCKHIYNYIDGYNKSALIAVSIIQVPTFSVHPVYKVINNKLKLLLR